MKKNGKDDISNIIYMIKLIFQANPSRLFVSIIREIIDKIFYVFFSVYLIQYMYLCIERQIGFKSFLIVITVACVGQGLLHIFTVWYQYYLSKTEPKIYEYIYIKVIKKALEMELSQFEDSEFYDKYSRALNEVIKRSNEVIKTLSQGIASLIGVLITMGFIIYIDSFLLIFAILPLVSSFVVGNKRNKLMYKKDMEMTYYERKVDYVKRIFYEKKYAPEIRLFNIKNVFFKDYEESYDSIIGKVKKYGKNTAILNAIHPIIMEVGVLVGSLIYISYKIVVKGTMSAANCVALINAIGTVSQDMKVLIMHIIDFNKHGMYIRNLREFLEYVPKVKCVKYSKLNRFKHIKLKDVSYTYSGQKKSSLMNISITIKKGEKVAIVGNNGSGKTTLIKLIMRLYDVSAGEIQLNDKNINYYDKKEYNNMFSVILQDYQIYALSLAENVLMDNLSEGKCEDIIKRSLENVGFEEKLKTLNNGIYSTLTKEFCDDGIVFSGGESQKVALSRVFAKNSDIFILDEPSSALDPIAEFNMYERIIKETKDKTVIFISHRLSSVIMADKIYMLENGQIIEEGNHEELMKINGKYAYMFKKQAEKYITIDEMKISI